MYILGFDIGGTKCAVITAYVNNNSVTLLKKLKCPTDKKCSPYEMIDRLMALADSILEKTPDAIGIACGGPLDSEHGIILCPPNLDGWLHVEIVKHIHNYYGVPVRLQNDANACAIAEWKFGAGQGMRNMVFLTFGTGLGAGLILDGRLYCGTNDNAGEIGHIRLADQGPTGFGKAGSFEGFCSGGGIASLGRIKAAEAIKAGQSVAFMPDPSNLSSITAREIALAAEAGDPIALDIYRTSGTYLGRGLSIIIDFLNPEAIILGGIFGRSETLLRAHMQEEIQKEALSFAAACCTVLPSRLGEQIGDYASIATAIM